MGLSQTISAEILNMLIIAITLDIKQQVLYVSKTKLETSTRILKCLMIPHMNIGYTLDDFQF